MLTRDLCSRALEPSTEVQIGHLKTCTGVANRFAKRTSRAPDVRG